jgi:hypothetical protein
MPVTKRNRKRTGIIRLVTERIGRSVIHPVTEKTGVTGSAASAPPPFDPNDVDGLLQLVLIDSNPYGDAPVEASNTVGSAVVGTATVE